MKYVFFLLLVLQCLLIGSCGQYGALTLSKSNQANGVVDHEKQSAKNIN